MIDLKEIQNKILIKENFYSLIIILIVFTLDRFSKIEILKNFDDNVFYINEFLNLSLIWNTGIGFGLLSFDSNLIYNLISGFIGLVVSALVYMAFKSDTEEKIFFSIIIGGALGNFYDRITYKAVPDFIDLHYNSFHWFTFNVADIFITIGIFAYILKGFFRGEKG